MKRETKRVRFLATMIFSLTIAAAVIFGLLVVIIYRDINFAADERLFDSARSFNSTTVYANAAEDNAEYLPIAIETGGSMRKIFYSLDEISPLLKEGFIAVEDKKFESHKGVDLKRTIMATANYLLGRSKVFGASTITQQVVKNISGDNQLSIKRKLQEIIRAIHIERNYTKEDILEVYLNVIPMSENIYGVGAASRAYFGKEPSELLPEEAAMLIGITNAPTAYNPYLNPESCKKKRDIILSVMNADGIISDLEYERAKSTPIKVIDREMREDRVDSWFVERVIDEVAEDLSHRDGISHAVARMTVLGGGYKIYSTMRPSVQNTLAEYFENTDNFPQEIKNGLNYAMAITDSSTGYLVGIVGRVGKKTANRLLNHATVPHIPGSTLKPMALYAPLIDEGRINWATVLDDVPVSFYESEEGYREYPKNSPAVYDGLTTVRDAICKSKNTIAVRLCNMRGTKKIFNYLRDNFGFTTLIEREGGITDIDVAPMALGQLGRGIPLIEMTESYSIFPGEGEWHEAISYLCLVDHKGRVIIDKQQGSREVIKTSTARIMNQLLMTVTDSGTASKITLKEYINTAGKTGTSGGSKDKTFIGYTPYYTAGIWCGYESGDRPITGLSKSHITIWDEIMTLIHEDIIREGNASRFSTEGLVQLPFCMDSGMAYTEVCAFDPRGNRRDIGYFTEDNMPTEKCERHILCNYDSITKAIACEGCPAENIVKVALISVPDRAFPKEIYVTDAEFVYRDTVGYNPRPDNPSLPYFEYSLPDGVYVGKSKREKQFNSNCYHHAQ